VQQHVGIRVPFETALVCNFHAAEDELPSVHQRMHIEALADSHKTILKNVT
jgi:hypothetical protein